MAKMDSSSRDTLLKLFDEIIEWRGNHKHYILNWTPNHLSVVRGYVSKLSLNSDLTVLTASELFKNTKDPNIVAYFTQELQKFFTVLRLHQLFGKDSTLRKNELVAAFINFLLQLLYHKSETDFVLAFEDQIGHLKKELRFLVTVLGDTILLCDEHEQVQNLLKEFEAVADEAGRLVHSFFFSVDPVFQSMDEGLDVFFKNIHLLKFSITIFLVLPPVIAEVNITPKTATSDSIFIADSLLRDLEHLLNHEDALIVDVKGQIKTLHQELMLSLSLLKDMKVDRPSEMEELREAELRIRDVAYEAEFLIGSFLVEDSPLWYFSIRLPHVIHKIKLIGTGLLEIKRDYHDIIGVLKVAKDFNAQLSVEAKTNSQGDDIIVGFEDNVTDILDQLVGGTEQLQIISIFGMPGLGKTTFAMKLYTHPSVYYRFDKCSWSVVSQTYQRKSLLADILISSSRELDKDRILIMDEEILVEQIYKTLKGRRYLIVMDDIWDSNAWYDLRRCFPDDGNGSRILFTTRNKDVAPPSSIIYSLPLLSDDQCWELLEKKVFRSKPCPAHLQGIGKEIAANCRGLPLVVVVISGILSTMDEKESAWKEVGENVASYISSSENSFTMQILEFSYKHLPRHLKPCFLYLAVFPEDYEIPSRKLMRLWIAEGFIHMEEKNMDAEDAAEEYLMELIDRSLVIVSKRRSDGGGAKACVVHDLLRELCLRISERENFLKLVVDENLSLYEKGQRLLSLQSSIAPFSQHVRSLHGKLPETPFYVVNMTSLRVLGFNQKIDPARDLFGIEFLVQLRYLIVSDLHLPASIGSLVNLEYLHVMTSGTVVIPSAIMKLTKLRFILATHQAQYASDCRSSQTNCTLQSLSSIMINNLRDEEMLKCSPNLRKLRCQCRPFYDRDQNGHRFADLRFLGRLESLDITPFNGAPTAGINFPASIRKLTICRSDFPWEMMSMIGRLPNLRVLNLRHDAFVGEIWETRDGEFEQLRYLQMYKMEFDQWNVESSEHFPRLQRLVFSDCYNLKEVPREIGEIVTLQIIELSGWCLKSLVESAVQIEEEQREMGNEELRVISS